MLFIKRCGVLALFSVFLATASESQPPQERVLRSTEFGTFRELFVPGDPVPTPTGEITLEAWVFSEQDISGIALGRMNQEDPTNQVITLGLFEGKPHCNVDGNDVLAPTQIPIRTWTHLAMTSDATSLKLFVNGVEIGSALSTPLPPHNPPPWHWYVATPFTGGIAQVRVWTRSLLAAELDSPENQVIADPDLQLYWPLDDGEGGQARDLGPLAVSLQLGRDPEFDPYEPDWVDLDFLAQGPYFERRVVTGPDAYIGGAVIDLGNDNDDDYVRTSWIPDELLTLIPPFYEGTPPMPVTAYRNEGGTLVERTAELLEPDVIQLVRGMMAPGYAFDANGDGLEDLYLGDSGGDPLPPPGYKGDQAPGYQDRLLIRDEFGVLHDETSTRLPELWQFTHDGCVADIDLALGLDVFVLEPLARTTCLFDDPLPDPARCSAFIINDGAGHFSQDVTLLPEDFTRFVWNGVNYFPQQCTIGRFNDDLWPDLAVVGSPHIPEFVAQPRILLSDGTGSLSDAPPGFFPTAPHSGVKILAIDIDRDEDDDLFLISWNRPGEGPSGEGQIPIMLLWRNDGSGFTDVSHRLPTSLTHKVYDFEGLIAVDVNLDGWTDIIGRGPFPTTLLLNTGGWFVELGGVFDGFPGHAYIETANWNGDDLVDFVFDPNGTDFELFYGLTPIHVPPFFSDGFEAGDVSAWMP